MPSFFADNRMPLLTLMLAVLLAGCAGLPPRTAVPADQYIAAEPAGYGRVRAWGDVPSDTALNDVADLWSGLLARSDAGDKPSFTALVLSGGAEDGSFGAGLLNGWSEAGDRPEFDIVTGVSTGALIAPLAFLGADYDSALRDMYIETTGFTDIFTPQILNALVGNSLAFGDSAPLRARIEAVVTEAVVADIAAQHARGRRLIVGTTNFDARRPVLWDIGAIAASDGPKRLELIHDVLLASASIPGVAPPVLIEVEAGGQRFHEMHVDGGVQSTVAFAAPGLSLRNPFPDKLSQRLTVYAIQNNKLRDSYGPAKDSLLNVVSGTVSALIRSQGRGDQLRLYYLSRRDGFDYRLAAVPQDFQFEALYPFDPAYMKALYEVGFSAARSGYPWLKSPPEIVEVTPAIQIPAQPVPAIPAPATPAGSAVPAS